MNMRSWHVIQEFREMKSKNEIVRVIGWNRNKYYIKWKGYLISEALWEPEQAFSDDGNMLSLYKRQHQL